MHLVQHFSGSGISLRHMSWGGGKSFSTVEYADTLAVLLTFRRTSMHLCSWEYLEILVTFWSLSKTQHHSHISTEGERTSCLQLSASRSSGHWKAHLPATYTFSRLIPLFWVVLVLTWNESLWPQVHSHLSISYTVIVVSYSLLDLSMTYYNVSSFLNVTSKG